MGRTNENKTKSTTMVFAALGAVFITICSWITVPMIVPFTLQTFAIFLVLSVFGGRTSLLSIAVYIGLGMVGLPVFAGFNSGIGCLMGPTGGFVIGFVFVGLIYIIVTKLFGEKLWIKAIGLALGLLVCYGVGTAWFVMVYSGGVDQVSVASALGMCVLPFVIPDLVKMVLAMVIGKRLRNMLNMV